MHVAERAGGPDKILTGIRKCEATFVSQGFARQTLKPWGQKSGGPAVRGIVAEIDPFCNGNLAHPGALRPNLYANTMHA
jgi:hypothetical protein